jgi:hypothetical protein
MWWTRGVDVAALLRELFDRIPPLAHHAVDGLSTDRLIEAPAPGANTIAWLVWHLARVQDDHVADLLGGSTGSADQLWVTGDWADGFGLDRDPGNTGYGHTASEVASIRPASPSVLLGYLDAVAARTDTMLAGVRPADLDRVVDEAWDPPVTLGVRLVSIANDCLQHAGQAAYVRGLLDR